MRRRKSTIFFVVLGICLISLAVALQVGWILLNLQQIAMLVLGMLFFALIITGLVLNTTFLVREIRKSEQQDAFLNAVTHELKTPIASIRLYLETLKKRDLSEEKREKFYDIMLADSDRLLGTVEQVLAASKVREKHAIREDSKLDLRSLVEDCAIQICNRYHLDADTVKISGGIDPISIEANRSEMESVFVNLLDNAVKYSGESPDITVKVLKRQNGTAEVHIKDKGLGIDSSDLKRIFKRFYRVSSNGQAAKGTGLGLYIVRSIVESKGGSIHVKSRGSGKGSTFVVRMPASQ